MIDKNSFLARIGVPFVALSLGLAACGDAVEDAAEVTDAAADAAGDAADDAADAAGDAAEEVADAATGDDEMADDSMEEEGHSDDDMEDGEAMDDGEAMEDDAMADLPATVVDIATSSDDFSTLVAALTEAGLVETLQGEGPFTVFAPTNAAFEQALTDLDISAEELLARDDLGDILTYHVVPGKILAADAIAADGTEIASVQGDTIAVSVVDGTVMVDGAAVTTADLEAQNGVVHVIDAVILPG